MDSTFASRENNRKSDFHLNTIGRRQKKLEGLEGELPVHKLITVFLGDILKKRHDDAIPALQYQKWW